MLRDYQIKARDSVLAAFSSGVQVTMIVIPTGGGKTFVFTHIANEFTLSGRILIIAHRAELIEQAADHVRKIIKIDPAIEKAEQYSPEDSMLGKPPIVIASIQTLNSGGDDFRRMERLKPEDFSLIVCDEFHHGISKTWRRVIDYFKQNPDCKILGCTATPDRADERGLKEICDHVAFDYELPDIIRDGYLCPIRQRRVYIDDLNFANIRTVGDDFDQQELEAAMLVEPALHGAIHATIESACNLPIGYLDALRDDADRVEKLRVKLNGIPSRKTLLFTISVSHAERAAEILNRWLPNSAAFVSGKTPHDERRMVLRNFAQGTIRFLCNCAIALEGFDEPSIEIVAMHRPTKSRSLYAQACGRALRPLDEIAVLLGECTESAERREIIAKSAKAYAEILDFSGNSGQHKLVCTIDLLGIARPQRVIDRASELIDENGMDSQSAIDQAGREIEQEQNCESVLEQLASEREDEADEREVSAAALRRMNLVATASYRIKQVSAFDDSVETPQVNPSNLTPKTIKALTDYGLKPQTLASYSQRQAGAVLNNLRKSKPAPWQVYKLERMGMTEGQASGMNFYDAMSVLYPKEATR